MNYFGTDGIRGEFGHSLTLDMAFRIGNFFSNKNIVLGTDTRKHSEALKNSFCDGVKYGGGSVSVVGVCPTAGIAFLTRNIGFDFGIAITASHNDIRYNGIKIFTGSGEKSSTHLENQISRYIDKNKINSCSGGQIDYNPVLRRKYIDNFRHQFDLVGMGIVLDCANGAVSEYVKEIYAYSKANISLINNIPNGENINFRCGSLHLATLKRAVSNSGADIGFAFDGDGDRVIAVEKNKVFDGDALLYVLATNADRLGIQSDVVIGTKMTNFAMQEALVRHGKKLLRADVGDKNVAALLERHSCFLGGESSGHIIISNYLPTGDGIYTALCVASIMKRTKKTLASLVDYTPNFAINKSVYLKDKYNALSSPKLKHIVKQAQKDLGVRILIRPSGTEDCIRVLVEGKDRRICKQISDELTMFLSEWS